MLTIDANHSEMCKFAGRGSAYEPVRHNIAEMCAAAIGASSLPQHVSPGNGDSSPSGGSFNIHLGSTTDREPRNWNHHHFRHNILTENYIERRDDSARLEAILPRSERGHKTGRAAIHGRSESGESQDAANYLIKHQKDYDLIRWIDFTARREFASQLEKLFDSLWIPDPLAR
ncbi:hypothetical protein BDD12DRAFT_189875 [Trichophaea hybrida]|nr:hypothetical protein BDD12DRAFT_189875 [Trichophaea hybrida]